MERRSEPMYPIPMRLAALLACSLPLLAQYSAKREGDLIRLEDAARQTVVLINPARGNNAFQMRVKGKDVVRFPHASVDEYLKSAGRGMAGIPFLGPWANRLDEMAFYANGKKYIFNPELGNVRPGANNIPIHGFLTTTPLWQVVETKADSGRHGPPAASSSTSSPSGWRSSPSPTPSR